jgi:hypothetical protein
MQCLKIELYAVTAVTAVMTAAAAALCLPVDILALSILFIHLCGGLAIQIINLHVLGMMQDLKWVK